MKALYCFFSVILLGLSIPLAAQQETLTQREAGLKAMTGAAFVKEALGLSKAYYTERNLSKATELAGLAYQEAAKDKDNEGMALALNHEGKALLADQGMRPAERLKVIRKLEESNTLSTRTALRLENLKMIRQVYTLLGKSRELREAEREIARLTAEQNRSLEQELEVAGEERKN